MLVTGGCGFVGSSIALKLRMLGLPVTAMDNLYRRGSELNIPRLEAAGVVFKKGDVRQKEDFPDEHHDLLIECAAEPSVLAGSVDPTYLLDTNLFGALNCLEFARKNSASFLFLSSSRVYPIPELETLAYREEESRFVLASQTLPGVSEKGIAETFSLGTHRSLYGASKLAAELVANEYHAAYGMPVIINRFGGRAVGYAPRLQAASLVYWIRGDWKAGARLPARRGHVVRDS